MLRPVPRDALKDYGVVVLLQDGSIAKPGAILGAARVSPCTRAARPLDQGFKRVLHRVWQSPIAASFAPRNATP
jgi:hypothetical protein